MKEKQQRIGELVYIAAMEAFYDTSLEGQGKYSNRAGWQAGAVCKRGLSALT